MQVGRVIEPVPLRGLRRETAIAVATRAGIRDEKGQASFADILLKLERLSREEECELVEINPLAIDSEGGSPIALDSKVILDDNALFRHPEFSRLPPEDPLEGEAAREGFAFVRLDGDIAVVGNGAGLVLSTLDLVSDAGREAGLLPRPGRRLPAGQGRGRAQARQEAPQREEGPGEHLRRDHPDHGRGRGAEERRQPRAAMQPVYARISGAEEEEAKKMSAADPGQALPCCVRRRSRPRWRAHELFRSMLPEKGAPGHRPGDNREVRQPPHRS